MVPSAAPMSTHDSLSSTQPGDKSSVTHSPLSLCSPVAPAAPCGGGWRVPGFGTQNPRRVPVAPLSGPMHESSQGNGAGEELTVPHCCQGVDVTRSRLPTLVVSGGRHEAGCPIAQKLTPGAPWCRPHPGHALLGNAAHSSGVLRFAELW